MTRKIIHIDMDCFFAAVEVCDNPQLKGHPVAVGGSAERRGVLATCNYEARKFGLHSAMSTVKAIRLCPQLILLPVAMEKYRAASREIQKIFHRYTDIVEPLSLDEAYLDVTASQEFQGSATRLATQIREEITHKTQLSASGGIAPNKFLSKVASDWNKPNGQFTIAPYQVEQFVKTLPVKKIPGVGKVTERKLNKLGIKTCAQLQTLPEATLIETFGKFGQTLYLYSRGTDHRCIEPSRVRKSVSVEHTFSCDLKTLAACETQVMGLYKTLQARLQKHANRIIRKQFVKIKFSDFTQTTKECVVAQLTQDTFLGLLRYMMSKTNKSVRLLGIGVSFQDESKLRQQALF